MSPSSWKHGKSVCEQKDVKNEPPKSENNLYFLTADTGLSVAEKIKASD
jgi:hypothetical protein